MSAICTAAVMRGVYCERQSVHEQCPICCHAQVSPKAGLTCSVNSLACGQTACGPRDNAPARLEMHTHTVKLGSKICATDSVVHLAEVPGQQIHPSSSAALLGKAYTSACIPMLVGMYSLPNVVSEKGSKGSTPVW